jgi:hypothetical protein
MRSELEIPTRPSVLRAGILTFFSLRVPQVPFFGTWVWLAVSSNSTTVHAQHSGARFVEQNNHLVHGRSFFRSARARALGARCEDPSNVVGAPRATPAFLSRVPVWTFPAATQAARVHKLWSSLVPLLSSFPMARLHRWDLPARRNRNGRKAAPAPVGNSWAFEDVRQP